jgi:hypothetical protein
MKNKNYSPNFNINILAQNYFNSHFLIRNSKKLVVFYYLCVIKNAENED